MTWTQLATENLRAARMLLREGHPRASVTRSYYAAYCAVTSELSRRGITRFGRFNNPSHEKLGTYLLNNCGLKTTDALRVESIVTTMYLFRVDADHRPTVLVTATDASALVSDASIVLGTFGVAIL